MTAAQTIPLDAAIAAAQPALEPPEAARTPYRPPMPFGMTDDLVVETLLTDDERLWVPQSDSVAFRPLVFE